MLFLCEIHAILLFPLHLFNWYRCMMWKMTSVRDWTILNIYLQMNLKYNLPIDIKISFSKSYEGKIRLTVLHTWDDTLINTWNFYWKRRQSQPPPAVLSRISPHRKGPNLLHTGVGSCKRRPRLGSIAFSPLTAIGLHSFHKDLQATALLQ